MLKNVRSLRIFFVLFHVLTPFVIFFYARLEKEQKTALLAIMVAHATMNILGFLMPEIVFEQDVRLHYLGRGLEPRMIGV